MELVDEQVCDTPPDHHHSPVHHYSPSPLPGHWICFTWRLLQSSIRPKCQDFWSYQLSKRTIFYILEDYSKWLEWPSKETTLKLKPSVPWNLHVSEPFSPCFKKWMTYPHIPASFLESLGMNKLTLGSGTFLLLPFENCHGLGFFRLISFQLAMIIIFSKNDNSLKNLNCKKKKKKGTKKKT